MRLLACLFVLGLATPVAAQPAARTLEQVDGEKAVTKARAAFEYRDFAQVITLLDPWLHPPRLVDKKLRIEAHRLLGVSLHITGKKKEARSEFARLLELDPKQELDPFVTPPSVVETFQAVREDMRPALDAIKPPPPKVVDPPVQTVKLVEVPHPAAALLPFGIPQFLVGKAGWGALWATLQGVALVANLGALLRVRLEPDRMVVERIERNFAIVQVAAFGTYVGSYAASSIQGYLQIQDVRSAALPPPNGTLPPPPAASLGWSFQF